MMELPELSGSMFEGVWVAHEGRIRSTLRCSLGQEAAQVKEGCVLVPGRFDTNTVYFADGQPLSRPALSIDAAHGIAADGGEMFSTPVPVGTEVRRDGARVGIADDGIFEFCTTVPGDYEFDLRPPFPWRPVVIVVTAHAV